MTSSLNVEQTRDMFLYTGEQMIKSKPYLTELDSAIGDGDHGVGMEVGFANANEKLRNGTFASINDIFKTVGMTMISTMGGASGIIFGTMFAGGIKGMEPLTRLDAGSLAEIMERALAAVKERGKADVGDKTMIDAFEPAVRALKESAARSDDLLEALRRAEEEAARGAENSKGYEAKFGRAKTLGARAIGHPDAGAVSVSIIFRSMREWVERHGA
ncbi:MAG: dihydroxyacetone kinase subunit L [Paenibacillaceae bacterium ZCTH02-B3]|nr:MAG: dihydroxyacetone kinase subunit L [Paenibacillaceae bacterium ZCTH02-B3]